MNIKFNDKTLTVDDDISISELLNIVNSESSNIAVALNNQVIAKSQWATTLIHNGDCILVIKASYGG